MPSQRSVHSRRPGPFARGNKKGGRRLNTAIVDDEEWMRNHLKDLISQYSEKNGVSAKCDLYASGRAFLSAAKHKTYDIVFLDIYMDAPDGIAVAKTLRKNDVSCLIIFLTSSDAHRASAFSVHAFDYLEKPISSADLEHTLNDAQKILTKNGSPYIDVPVKKQVVSILYSDLLYATADSNYVIIQANETYRCRMLFHSLADTLAADSRFLAINRGVLVNLDYVVSMDNLTCTLKDGASFPLNKKTASSLKQRYITRQFACRTEKVSKGGGL